MTLTNSWDLTFKGIPISKYKTNAMYIHTRRDEYFINARTISVWDTKRNIRNEDFHLKQVPLYSTEVGIGHSDEIISLQPFVNYTERIVHFRAAQTNEICSLDQGGDVILWSLILKQSTMKDGVISSTNWNDVILVKNIRVSLKTIYPDLADLQCTDCVVNSMDSNYIIVSTNYGFIIHHLIKGGRSNVKKFVPGCGDKTRMQKQVCEIFNTKYPDRRISQSTVSRIENKFREFGNVTDIPKSNRKRILDDEQKLDILLDIQDNPHKPTRQVAADNDVTSKSCANCLEPCPFSPNYFLAGFSDGNINLYSRLVEKPLMVLSDKEGQFGKSDIQIIQWSRCRPFIIYTKDVNNTIHIWDLNDSDIYPIYSFPSEKNITCMKLSPLLMDTDIKKSYMITGTEDGYLYLHLLSTEHGQQSCKTYKEHVNTFFKLC
ncbi:hypothetical protein NQ318_014671 [Aromia moschata]|uniref:Uncharacterized protein n=1 Tax=Aromia moschata TaxID=1265417 RepID=A0AAV8ZDG9_9CUCU|nr:hypothetical protein NQ318_014671 [Aromia moschata]